MTDWYLSRATEMADVELYSCWSGDEADEPEERTTITPDDIGGPAFQFKERQFLLVEKSPASTESAS